MLVPNGVVIKMALGSNGFLEAHEKTRLRHLFDIDAITEKYSEDHEDVNVLNLSLLKLVKGNKACLKTCRPFGTAKLASYYQDRGCQKQPGKIRKEAKQSQTNREPLSSGDTSRTSLDAYSDVASLSESPEDPNVTDVSCLADNVASGGLEPSDAETLSSHSSDFEETDISDYYSTDDNDDDCDEVDGACSSVAAHGKNSFNTKKDFTSLVSRKSVDSSNRQMNLVETDPSTNARPSMGRWQRQEKREDPWATSRPDPEESDGQEDENSAYRRAQPGPVRTEDMFRSCQSVPCKVNDETFVIEEDNVFIDTSDSPSTRNRLLGEGYGKYNKLQTDNYYDRYCEMEEKCEKLSDGNYFDNTRFDVSTCRKTRDNKSDKNLQQRLFQERKPSYENQQKQSSDHVIKRHKEGIVQTFNDLKKNNEHFHRAKVVDLILSPPRKRLPVGQEHIVKLQRNSPSSYFAQKINSDTQKYQHSCDLSYSERVSQAFHAESTQMVDLILSPRRKHFPVQEKLDLRKKSFEEGTCSSSRFQEDLLENQFSPESYHMEQNGRIIPYENVEDSKTCHGYSNISTYDESYDGATDLLCSQEDQDSDHSKDISVTQDIRNSLCTKNLDLFNQSLSESFTSESVNVSSTKPECLYGSEDQISLWLRRVKTADEEPVTDQMTQNRIESCIPRLQHQSPVRRSQSFKRKHLSDSRKDDPCLSAQRTESHDITQNSVDNNTKGQMAASGLLEDKNNHDGTYCKGTTSYVMNAKQTLAFSLPRKANIAGNNFLSAFYNPYKAAHGNKEIEEEKVKSRLSLQFFGDRHVRSRSLECQRMKRIDPLKEKQFYVSDKQVLNDDCETEDKLYHTPPKQRCINRQTVNWNSENRSPAAKRTSQITNVAPGNGTNSNKCRITERSKNKTPKSQQQSNLDFNGNGRVSVSEASDVFWFRKNQDSPTTTLARMRLSSPVSKHRAELSRQQHRNNNARVNDNQSPMLLSTRRLLGCGQVSGNLHQADEPASLKGRSATEEFTALKSSACRDKTANTETTFSGQSGQSLRTRVDGARQKERTLELLSSVSQHNNLEGNIHGAEAKGSSVSKNHGSRLQDIIVSKEDSAYSSAVHPGQNQNCRKSLFIEKQAEQTVNSFKVPFVRPVTLKLAQQISHSPHSEHALSTNKAQQNFTRNSYHSQSFAQSTPRHPSQQMNLNDTLSTIYPGEDVASSTNTPVGEFEYELDEDESDGDDEILTISPY